MEVKNLNQKFGLFDELWTPKIIDQCNGQMVKIAKVQGDFVWHDHKDEDELFLVVKGKLFIDLRDETLELSEGEMVVIPKGTEHRPRTGSEEVWILLLEPESTKHTGEIEHELTVNKADYI